MKPCPACGTENPDTSQRCSVCGGSLEPTLAATVVATTRKTPREQAPTSDSEEVLLSNQHSPPTHPPPRVAALDPAMERTFLRCLKKNPAKIRPLNGWVE